MKMDDALQTAAESDPDATLRLIVVTMATDRAAKAHALSAAGFQPTLSDGDPRSIVVTATPREAMVLAEDAGIEAIAIEPAAGQR